MSKFIFAFRTIIPNYNYNRSTIVNPDTSPYLKRKPYHLPHLTPPFINLSAHPTRTPRTCDSSAAQYTANVRRTRNVHCTLVKTRFPHHTRDARRRRTGWWGGFLRPLTALPGRVQAGDGEVPRPKQLHPRAAILLKMRGRGLPEGWPRPAKVAPFFDWCMPGPFVQPRAAICPLPAPRDRCPPTSPPFFRAILKERLVPLVGGPGRRRHQATWRLLTSHLYSASSLVTG